MAQGGDMEGAYTTVPNAINPASSEKEVKKLLSRRR